MIEGVKILAGCYLQSGVPTNEHMRRRMNVAVKNGTILKP